MTINFADALNTNLDSIERPPLPPVGTYTFQVMKVPSYETSGDGKWDILTFPCQAVEASEDVDPDELASFGALKNVFMRHSFVFNKEDQKEYDRTLYNLRRFLETSLKVPFEGVALKEALNSAVNQRFMGAVTWKADKRDPELQNANIGRTAPVE